MTVNVRWLELSRYPAIPRPATYNKHKCRDVIAKRAAVGAAVEGRGNPAGCLDPPRVGLIGAAADKAFNLTAAILCERVEGNAWATVDLILWGG